MEECMFKKHLARCRHVTEATTYLTLYNYIGSYCLCQCDPWHLTIDSLNDFLHEQGEFYPPVAGENSKLSSKLRLIIQKDAMDLETFTPLKIPLPPAHYEQMLKCLRLPLHAVELTTFLGPLFWYRYVVLADDDPHLQIVFGKHDSRKKTGTRGWELILSYSFKRLETTGFVKWTPTADITECLSNLRDCVLDISHPLLIPSIIMSGLVATTDEVKQREARTSIRQLEKAISVNDDTTGVYYAKDGTIDLRAVASDLTEHHRRILHRPPKLYSKVIDSLEAATDCFWANIDSADKTKALDRLHATLKDRFQCHRVRLVGLEKYVSISVERLNIQRSMVSFITAEIAQKDAKLNLKIAGDQRKIAHASKSDSQAMKALSLLGAAFLPGTFIASIFSMSFFDFQTRQYQPHVSSKIWIYFAFMIPLTTAVLLGWLFWDHKRRRSQHFIRSATNNTGSDTEMAILSELSKRL
ncbi:hypothetical protein BDP81DRAFT_310936 [Colletotrichum phormii]|uniref:Uncharacterized protein n=1 Tax=Colletotrichum phormii TaxID=359342 RepID=A0AAI9ZYY1_9PEZI|nr:uncharacterized protein BDP81DRAFT_310936 [Colletotrichum phormii]KAK1640786.1 hypothetical protein BDP81DRAFT_310936 [Colletotrichum phormii]